jgi:hypothetical protein
MKRVWIVVAAALTLTACETATPYQPISARTANTSGGFSEQQIEANRWRVAFAGNSLTSRQTVERYLLFRSAQLTLNQGFDWFQAVDRHTEQQTNYYGDADPFLGGWGGGLDWGLYRPGFGWGYGYGGFGGFGGFGYGGFGGGPFDVEQVTRYTATVEILMGHGAKPANNARAYDARSVVEHLQGAIQYPKPS